MPLADVMTFYLAAPIYVTALSPFILRENVGWRRWAAVIIGFVGVMIALNPSAQSLTPAALVAIAGSLTYAFFLTCTRMVRGTSDVVLVTASFAGALVFGLVAAPFTWVALRWQDAWLLCLLGVVATLAHVCVNRSLKIAPASVVVPYQYTMIVWAILLGFIFFNDVPRIEMLAGAATIIAAGIYIFVRERVRATPSSFADPP
jgi:drug/metabolite transporter (DMT)-like permease